MPSWGRIFAFYTGAFVVFTILLSLLQHGGLISQAGIGYTYLVVTIGMYALIGVLSRTARPDQYYVAGRPPSSAHGHRIAPEQLDAVFERFRQVGDTLTGKPEGAGLGLPISREIAHQHGGSLSADSAVGRGSCFRLTLPLIA